MGLPLLKNADKGDFQKRSHKFHLYELFLGLGEGEHGGDPLHHDRLADAPEERLRVSVQRLPGHQLQAQVVRQEVVPGLSEAGEGAVQGSLHPGRLASRQKGTQAHGVSDLRQDVAGLGMEVTRVDDEGMENDLEPEESVQLQVRSDGPEPTDLEAGTHRRGFPAEAFRGFVSGPLNEDGIVENADCPRRATRP
ncbi:hypothetical protein AAFF_G00258000 [Aldrovandia affinis]|uniref:Uncharacterized protein n=1 Tax=Aldrovandia affinis TaxID=143900 RepID=A0AAD7WT19_9TELE|nr:hypothetical protein AAFF_G00258000 [Aldrovandia affinis]